MKKLSFLFLSLYLALANISAQDIVVTFIPKDASNTIDSIKATKIETGETASVEGSNTINMSSIPTGTNLFPTNPEEISVYPNPFENYTLLEFHSTQNDNIKISLVNASGQAVAEKNQNITFGIHQFNISTSKNGLYILNVTGNQTKFSQKIISTNNNQSPDKIEYNGYTSIPVKEKSAKIEGGEIIHFFVYSGDNITKIADTLSESKTYEVEFFECKDDSEESYPIVQIGDQWWMAENLAYDVGNGCSAYNNDENNVATYGRLYTWEAAKKACPDDWHLPTDNEWKQLEMAIGMSQSEANDTLSRGTNIGTKLKATSGWNSNGNGTDDFGFSALAGSYGASANYFGYIGNSGYWWSATEGNYDDAWLRSMSYGSSGVNRYSSGVGARFSARCVKD